MNKLIAGLLCAFCLSVEAAPPAFIYSPYVYFGDNMPISNQFSTAVTLTYPTSTPPVTVLSVMPSGLSTVTWAFGTGTCGSETWSGTAGATVGTANITPFVTAGKKYVVSFGGEAGTFQCASNTSMLTTLGNYYSANMLGADFDIEGGATGGSFTGSITGSTLTYSSGTTPAIGTVLESSLVPPGTEIISGTSPTFTLNKSVTGTVSGSFFGSKPTAYSQAQINSLIQTLVNASSTYPNLRWSFTVGAYGGTNTAAHGMSLDSYGVYVWNAIQQYGLTNWTINLMAFDMINDATHCVQVPNLSSCEMGLSAAQAAVDVHNFYGIPYSQIEITTMIGQDDNGEMFVLPYDADFVSGFALLNGIGGVHFWQLNRDRDCPATTVPVIDQCNSYGSGGTLGFTKAFINGLSY